jgi:signal transduction histidine kinase
MENMIEDILDLAREDQTVTETARVNIQDLCEECWRTVDTRGASLEVTIQRPIHADRQRLRQVFENLFRNAIDHGRDDSSITVGQLPDGFYVEDNGPGIPAEERETVFERGYSTAKSGTGFGLTIVKQVVDAHGWEVTVTEGAQGGARFEIVGVKFADN